MRVEFVCPKCNIELEAAEESAGKRIRCPNEDCQTTFTVPVLSKTRRQLVLLFSFAWVILGWMIAWFAPYVDLWGNISSHLGDLVPLLLTIILIGSNLSRTIRTIIRTGIVRKAVPFILAQIALFHLLFFQIACHMGAQHFDWEQQPQAWDWVEFSAIHTFRASDIFDTLEAYGLRWQTIQHSGWLMTTALIVFHFIINLFFVTLLAQTLHGLISHVERWMKALFGVFVLIFLIAFVRTAFLGPTPWRTIDVILWPIDNLLRVIDFFDALELVDFHLHQVPKLAWEGTLTMMCRILMVALIAEWVAGLFQRFWKGVLSFFGYTDQQIDIFHQSMTVPDLQLDDRQFRQTTRRKTTKANQTFDDFKIGGWVFLFGIVLPVLMLVIPQLAPWDRTVSSIVASIRADLANSDGDSPQVRAAFESLARMGAHGESAIEPLAEMSQLGSPGFQSAAIETLGQLGPKALEPLGRILSDDSRPEAQLAAARSLDSAGYRGTPILLRGLASKNEPVRQTVREVIDRAGGDAVSLLAGALTPENRTAVLPLIQQLDPYWQRQPKGSPFFVQVVANVDRVKQLTQELQATDPARRLRALRSIADIGPAAGEAIPKVIERIGDPLLETEPILDTIRKLGPEVVLHRDQIADHLQNENARIRERSLRILAEMGPNASSVIDRILIELISVDTTNVGLARSVLAQIDPQWQRSPSARQLIPRLLENACREGLSSGRHAYDVLVELDANWHQSAEVIRTLPELARSLTNPNLPQTQVGNILEVLERVGKLVPETIPALTRWINSNDSVMRLRAIRLLEKFGNAARPAANELVVACVHSDPKTREAARKALEQVDRNWAIQFGVRTVVPRLVPALSEPDEAVILIACTMIQSIGEEAAEAVPALLILSRKPSVKLRVTAIDTLGRIGKPARIILPDLVEHFADANDQVIQALTTAIARIDPDWKTNDQLIYGVTRMVRVLVPSGLGTTQTRLTPADARTALLRLGPKVVPALMANLNNTDTYSLELVRILCQIAKDHVFEDDVPSIIPTLIKIMRNSAEAKRYALLEVLVSANASPELSAALIERLTDDSPRIRALAVTTLSRRGANLLTTLSDRLKDPNESIRLSTLEVVDRLRVADPTKLDEVLIKAVRARLLDRSERVRSKATEVLVSIGARAVAVLIDWLDDVDSTTRLVAIRTLKGFNHVDARKAFPGLIACLKDPINEVRYTTLDTLGQIGPPDLDVINAMIKILQAEDPRIRSLAAIALSINGKAGEKGVIQVARLLKDPVASVRENAILSLQQYGPNATRITVDLIEAMTDVSPAVRLAAEKALGKIDGKWLQSAAVAPAMGRIVKGMKAAPGDQHVTYSQLISYLANQSPLGMQTLIEQVGDPDFTIRALALQELPKANRNWAKSAGAKKALPVLQTAIASNDPARARAAEDALLKIGR